MRYFILSWINGEITNKEGLKSLFQAVLASLVMLSLVMLAKYHQDNYMELGMVKNKCTVYSLERRD